MPGRDPGDVTSAALRLLARASTPAAVRDAAALLGPSDPRLRAALLARFAELSEAPFRRDPGADLRCELLHALRPMLTTADLPLLEAAAQTYEKLPRAADDSAANLRGSALILINDLDETVAAFHATRLLMDARVSGMSGEPAITAVRVLVAQRQLPAIYAYLMEPPAPISEVVADGLRAMVAAPFSVVAALVEKYLGETDQILLLGLMDLLIGRGEREELDPIVLEFLENTDLDDLYLSVVTTVVASRHPTLIDGLRARPPAPGTVKARLLAEALSLLSPGP